MTDYPADLAAALAQLQTQLPVIQKTSKAQYGNYADLADVSRELLPVMGKLGLSFSAKPTWVTREDGSREFVLKYRLLHTCGQYDEGEYPLGSNPSNHQQLGSAITYGRRYSLCAITGAVAEDDDDGQAASQPATTSSRQRGRPPVRAAGALPRNRDGSVSRSQATDEELADAGNMTPAQLKEHNKLERDTLAGSKPAERLNATPEDDPWLDAPAGQLPVPHAAPPKAGVIHAHFKRLGFTDDEREQRLAALSAMTGRTIKSTNDLTAAEGLRVADDLAKCRDRGQLIERLAVKAGEDIA